MCRTPVQLGDKYFKHDSWQNCLLIDFNTFKLHSVKLPSTSYTRKKQTQNKVCSGNAGYQLLHSKMGCYCSILPAPFMYFLQCQKVLKYWIFKSLITFTFTQYDNIWVVAVLSLSTSVMEFLRPLGSQSKPLQGLNGDCSQHKPATRLSPQLNRSSWNSRDEKGLSANVMFSVC